MKQGFYIFALIFFSALSVSAFAAEVPSDGSIPPEEEMQPAPIEIKPEPQSGSVPATESATTSAAGASNPRPTPTVTPVESVESATTPSAASSVPVTETELETPIPLPTSTPVEEFVSPWMWLVGLLALAGGSVYGAYSLMKASQPKGAQSANTCDAIEESLDQKQYELSLVEHEFSVYEETLRVLEEKAQERVQAEKNKVVKKIESVAKDTVLGKKGESESRAAFDTAEKVKDTFDDIQKKIKKAKEVADMLRGKRDGLTAEVKTLEASYVACVANLPDAAKALAGSGFTLAVPSNRPVRAIIFDWAGVMATEAFWIWGRKNEIDMTQIMAVDMQVNTGEMRHEEFVAFVAKVSGKKPEEVWKGVKGEMILNEELIARIRELKKKYKIGLLSNFTAPWLREVIDENKLWDLFDEHIISSEHALVKPDRKIYKKMLTLLDVPAEECVFADDRQVNVDAAKKLGIRAFIFSDVAQFTKDLKTVGVSLKPEEGEVSKQ